MEFKQIQYFLKLSECSSFTDASEKLYISQQALSKSIINLEKELNTRLFARSRNGIKLTEDGVYLKNKFKHICSIYDEACEETFKHYATQSGKLEIGVCPGFFRSLPMTFLIEFQQEHPTITIEQLEKYDKDCEDYVREDFHRFALTTKPWHPQGLYYVPLHREKLFFIAHKDNPLAKYDELHMSDLRDEKFVSFTNRYNLYYRTIEGCKNAGFTPNIVYMSADVSQLVKLASDGIGILICVEHVYRESNHENMVCIPIVDSEMYWEIGVISKNYYKLESNAKLFISQLYGECVATAKLPKNDIT